MHHAHVRDVDDARRQGLITEAEASELRAAADAVDAAIAVDDFAPEELAPRQAAEAARRRPRRVPPLRLMIARPRSSRRGKRRMPRADPPMRVRATLATPFHCNGTSASGKLPPLPPPSPPRA